MKKKETKYSFVCQKCGYKSVKPGKLPECPLCKICTRCGKPVRNCICIEGE